MTASLSITCGCGRLTSAPCPNLSDILTVKAQFVDWGHDDRGLVRCPECLAGGNAVAPPPEPAQLSLLDRAA